MEHVRVEERGIDVEVPWKGGTTSTVTGNSYAAPHIAGIAARILSKHPELRPFQVKAVLYACAANVREADDAVAGRMSRVLQRTGAGTDRRSRPSSVRSGLHRPDPCRHQ